MNATEILKAHRLQLTASRKSVLAVLIENGPLTQIEIKNRADSYMNRITIYRSLRVFVNKGIVSQLKDENGTSKFFLNRGPGKNHVHFKCTECGHLSELDSSGMRYAPMPQGYVPEKRNLFIVGICGGCNKKNSRSGEVNAVTNIKKRKSRRKVLV